MHFQLMMDSINCDFPLVSVLHYAFVSICGEIDTEETIEYQNIITRRLPDSSDLVHRLACAVEIVDWRINRVLSHVILFPTSRSFIALLFESCICKFITLDNYLPTHHMNCQTSIHIAFTMGLKPCGKTINTTIVR